MSSQVDKKYINLVSPQLEKFTWKKDNLANCRCPVCGDSQKNKNKCRGYFYEKSNAFFYRCHNCQHSCNLYTFLKDISPALYKPYSVEKFKDGKNTFGGNFSSTQSKTKEKVDDAVFRSSKPVFSNFKVNNNCEYLKDLVCVEDLSKKHPCRQFIESRLIPKESWHLLFYTDDFGSWMKKLDPFSLHGVGKEPRLVIPFFDPNGNVVAGQGRAINYRDEANARYTAKYLTARTKLAPGDLGKEDKVMFDGRYLTTSKDSSIPRGEWQNAEKEPSIRRTHMDIRDVRHCQASHKLWYGQWRVNPDKRVYLVEGPLDSLFLDNCMASVGLNLPSLKTVKLDTNKNKIPFFPSHLQNSDCTFVIDNEPRNTAVVATVRKIIDIGMDVVIWPEDMREKDINDLAYRLSKKKIKKLIDEHTFNGLEAFARMNTWKRCD